MKSAKCLLGFALFAVVFTITANAYVIDDFTATGDHAAEVTSGTGMDTDLQTGIPVANTIGGSRNLFVNVLANQFDLSGITQVKVGSGVMHLALDGGVNAFGGAAYDANGAGLGGVDITDGGLAGWFQALVEFSDQNLGFKTEITDTSANTATFQGLLGSGVSFINQQFVDFDNYLNTDFTLVDKIVVTLSGPAAQDGVISLLETTNNPRYTPEPGAAMLLLIGGASLIFRRRR